MEGKLGQADGTQGGRVVSLRELHWWASVGRRVCSIRRVRAGGAETKQLGKQKGWKEIMGVSWQIVEKDSRA